MVPIEIVDRAKPLFSDLGAHENWKNTLGEGITEVSHENIAKGMLNESSNTCTQFMLDTIGYEKVNAIIQEQGLNLPSFPTAFNELEHIIKGSASDVVQLMKKIAHEKPPIQGIFKEIASPLHVKSVNGSEASGFIKDGFAEMHWHDNQTLYDYNMAWCMEHNGKTVTACFLTNGIDADTKQFLEKRLNSFLCESSCNSDFRAECNSLIKNSMAMASSIWAHKGHLRPRLPPYFSI